jgi:hypothetical protein
VPGRILKFRMNWIKWIADDFFMKVTWPSPCFYQPSLLAFNFYSLCCVQKYWNYINTCWDLWEKFLTRIRGSNYRALFGTTLNSTGVYKMRYEYTQIYMYSNTLKYILKYFSYIIKTILSILTCTSTICAMFWNNYLQWPVMEMSRCHHDEHRLQL